MVRSDSPYIVDWYVVSFRWLILLGTTVSLSIGGSILSPANLLLVALTGWNIFLMWLVSDNRRLHYHREINAGVDFVFTALFFFLSGGLFGPAIWMILLPLISFGFYFNLVGGLVAAGLMVCVEAADIFINGTSW